MYGFSVIFHTSCGPSGFTVPQFYGTASYRADVCICLRHVVKVSQACIADRHVLPVAESIYEPSLILDNTQL